MMKMYRAGIYADMSVQGPVRHCDRVKRAVVLKVSRTKGKDMPESPEEGQDRSPDISGR